LILEVLLILENFAVGKATAQFSFVLAVQHPLDPLD
jgi:hypothetical protein